MEARNVLGWLAGMDGKRNEAKTITVKQVCRVVGISRIDAACCIQEIALITGDPISGLGDDEQLHLVNYEPRSMASPARGDGPLVHQLPLDGCGLIAL